jgi:tellurite resistance protein
MTDDFQLALQNRLRALAEEQRKRHARHSPHITKRQLLDIAARQEQQRIELLAEREDEAGNREQAKQYRQLAEAIAEIAGEMDP